MTTDITTAILLLNFVAGVSGLILAWKNQRLKATATKFDDSIQLIDAYRKEVDRQQLALEKQRQDIERLEKRLTDAEQRILQARHETAVSQQHLEEERRIFTQRLNQLSALLAEIKATESPTEKGE